MQEIILKVENLFKSFDTNDKRLLVLDNLSFEIYDKEFLTIVGPSGCGKTTLLRIIAGLDKPISGKIKLKDEVIKKPSIKIGYVPQNFSLFPWKTVFKNIIFGLKIQGVNKQQCEVKAKELLNLMGLSKFRKYFPKEISGGMKQKVAIARSLAIDQKIMLLDEPLRSLDAQSRNKLQDDIINIWQKSMRTILFITHSIDEAVYLSDRIILLSEIPSSIKKIVSVKLKRPRDRTSIEFNSIKRDILNEIYK